MNFVKIICFFIFIFNTSYVGAVDELSLEEASFYFEELEKSGMKLLVIFRVTEDIPEIVWDYLPYGTKIVSDFREFNRDDDCFSLNNNLTVMRLSLVLNTEYDRLFTSKDFFARSILAIHGDPLEKINFKLRCQY